MGHPIRPRRGRLSRPGCNPFLPAQRTAAAARATLGARNVVPAAEGLLSRRCAAQRRIAPQRDWTGPGRGSGRHGRHTEVRLTISLSTKCGTAKC